MAKFSIKSFALKWYFFTCLSSPILYAEYFSLFMKQLGFNPASIGLTSLLGLPKLLVPLYLLLGEKFRARKTAIFFATLAVSLCSMLPLLAVIVPALEPTCYATTSTDSVESTEHVLRANSTVYSEYTDNSNNLSVSKINKIAKYKPYLRSTITPAVKNLSMYQKHYTIPYLTWNSLSSTNYTSNLIHTSKIYRPQTQMFSTLYVVLTLSRLLTMYHNCANLALANLATITYLKEERASYGAYYLWINIGCTFSIAFVAVLAWFIKIDICGVEMPAYFIAFLCGGAMSLMSMLSIPSFKFEYHDKKSFNWSGVKSDVFNAHYIFMFALQFYIGLCLNFQVYWEFWYLDGLSASPLLLAGAVLIRRPLAAMSGLGSSYLIKRIGDLNTVSFALLLYSSSFLALSFTRIAWLVLVVDTFQAAANGIGYCAFTVLFSKASSKENSSMILGLQETVYAVGFGVGSSLMGVLFHALGTRMTLIIYSMITAALLVSLLLYIRFLQHDHNYKKLAQDDDNEQQ